MVIAADWNVLDTKHIPSDCPLCGNDNRPQSEAAPSVALPQIVRRAPFSGRVCLMPASKRLAEAMAIFSVNIGTSECLRIDAAIRCKPFVPTQLSQTRSAGRDPGLIRLVRGQSDKGTRMASGMTFSSALRSRAARHRAANPSS